MCSAGGGGSARPQGIEIAENVLAYLKRATAPNLLNAPAAPAEEAGAIAPLLELADKLGRFVAQTLEGPIKEVRVHCCGDAATQGQVFVVVVVVVGREAASPGH